MKNLRTRNLLKTTAVFFIAAVVLLLNACAKKEDKNLAKSEKKPQILVSSYVPYTLVKNLVKDMADVSMLMPPGVEPHSFEPLPKNILEVKKAPLFFYIDKTLEPWAYDINQNTAFALGQSLTTPQEKHIWMDFDKAFLMTQRASEDIKVKYPSLTTEIQTNLPIFQKEITALKTAYSTQLANCKTRDIYHIGHLAFGAIAKNYNLNFKPLVNSSQSQEPSPKDILEMIKQIKEKNIKYIFTEEALPPDMADLIAKQTGAQVLMLYTIEHVTKEEFDEQISYQDFMYKNLENLVKGLECS